MLEKIGCILVSIVSLISIFYASFDKNEIKTDLSTVSMANYIDVYFTSVSSKNGSLVSISSNKKGIKIDSIVLEHVGDSEVINYSIYNNSFDRDVNVSVLVNGVKNYQNDYFKITCSNGEDISSGGTINGSIEVTLIKASLEDIEIPFNVELVIEEKEYHS